MKNKKFLILGLSLSLGYYHYHCGGYSAHLHKSGCPYGKKSPNKTKNLKIQKRLKELGYNPGKADGVFGKKSKEALKNFQKGRGLKADGIPGKNTLKTLKL